MLGDGHAEGFPFLGVAHGGFEGTIAYGESAETALAKLKRLASGK